MGKKLNSKAKSRICKKEKEEFKSLVKVLRPKVYITDTSNFKRLVQELTGNSTYRPAFHDPELQEIEQQIQTQHQESSLEMSFDTSLDSLNCDRNQMVIDQTWNQIYEDVTAFDPNQQMDLSALESWLLDMNTSSFDSNFPQIDQRDVNTWPNLNVPDQN